MTEEQKLYFELGLQTGKLDLKVQLICLIKFFIEFFPVLLFFFIIMRLLYVLCVEYEKELFSFFSSLLFIK